MPILEIPFFYKATVVPRGRMMTARVDVAVKASVAVEILSISSSECPLAATLSQPKRPMVEYLAWRDRLIVAPTLNFKRKDGSLHPGKMPLGRIQDFFDSGVTAATKVFSKYPSGVKDEPCNIARVRLVVKSDLATRAAAIRKRASECVFVDGYLHIPSFGPRWCIETDKYKENNPVSVVARIKPNEDGEGFKNEYRADCLAIALADARASAEAIAANQNNIPIVGLIAALRDEVACSDPDWDFLRQTLDSFIDINGNQIHRWPLPVAMAYLNIRDHIKEWPQERAEDILESAINARNLAGGPGIALGKKGWAGNLFSFAEIDIALARLKATGPVNLFRESPPDNLLSATPQLP